MAPESDRRQTAGSPNEGDQTRVKVLEETEFQPFGLKTRSPSGQQHSV